MWPNPQFPVDLVTSTEEIFNGKLYFLCSAFFSYRKKTLLLLKCYGFWMILRGWGVAVTSLAQKWLILNVNLTETKTSKI